MSGQGHDDTGDVFDWAGKAEADLLAATELEAQMLADIVCFHCQQCAEKYLKALIVARGGEPDRTHDLLALVAPATGDESLAQDVVKTLQMLNPFSVTIRYPKADATPEEATRAIEGARMIRQWARRRLGLADDDT